MRTFLKELFTAYYNRQTDTIENCKEGSIVWWHEKGHRYVQEHYKTLVISIRDLSIMITVFALVYMTKEAAQLAFFPFFIITLGDEFYSWGYAIGNKYFKNAKWRR